MDVEEWVWFYWNNGFSIIPVKAKDKRPNVPTWADYQDRQPEKEKIEFWLKQKLFENIGVICGMASNNIVVIDIDDETIVEKLAIDLKKIYNKGHWIVKTGKGYHIYCKHNDNPGDTERDDNLHIEYRANGGYVVAPPSIHPSGQQYEFLFAKTPKEMKGLVEEDVKKVFDDMVVKLGGKTKKYVNIDDIKRGVHSGGRNNSAFRLSCDYRDKKLSIEETTKLLLDWNKKNNPPLPDLEILNCIRSAYKKGLLETNEITTLKEVYDTVDKYIHVNDYNRIDIILGTALSNQLKGTPIWMFIVGNSGDWKSAFAQSLGILPNCIKLDQITKNTLATGQKDSWDLGSDLQNRDTILFFPDLASLTSMSVDDKNAIWGQFRNLYDGFILKGTGGGVSKKYENCHVTMIACTTQAIRDEILIHAQLGTRELMYDTEPDLTDNVDKMDKAWENEEFEEQMKYDLQSIVLKFLTNRDVKVIHINNDIKEFLKEEAQRLSVLRASGMVDRMYKELINPIYPEIPTRIIKQFKRIYMSLKSLDDDYPDSKCKEIISRIVDSSGNVVRRMVLDELQVYNDWMKVSDVQFVTKLGRKTVKGQLEMLWNLGVINKEDREERIGGYPTFDYEAKCEIIRGGRIENISYYKFNGITLNSSSLDDFTDKTIGNV